MAPTCKGFSEYNASTHLASKLPVATTSAWQRPGAKFRFGAASGRRAGLEAQLRDLRSQAQLGNEDKYADHHQLFFFFFGTLPPFRRASDRPMAMACFRLLTFFPDLPLFNLPRLRSCIAFLTFRFAVLPYFAMTSPWFDRDVREQHEPTQTACPPRPRQGIDE
jgi:hypothetical protein